MSDSASVVHSVPRPPSPVLGVSDVLSAPHLLLEAPFTASVEVRPAPFLLPALTTSSGLLALGVSAGTRAAVTMSARGEPGTWTHLQVHVSGARALTPRITAGAGLGTHLVFVRDAAPSASITATIGARMTISPLWSAAAGVQDVGTPMQTIMLSAFHAVDTTWTLATDVRLGPVPSVTLQAWWHAADPLVMRAAMRTAPRAVSAAAVLDVADRLSLVIESTFVLDLGLTTMLGVQWSRD